MSITNFPFKKSGRYTPYRPLLPVKITNPYTGLSKFTWALIDTGSDSSVIPGFFAEAIGHEIENSVITTGRTAGGEVSVYKHTCQIDILSIFTHEIIMSLRKQKYDVIEELKEVLLGVDNFLIRHKLIIDYPRRVFSIL